MAELCWYAVIDGAQDPRLQHLVQTCREHVCLFKGALHPALAAAAPWLVAIRPDEPLLRTWQVHGKGRNWGIMCESASSLEVLRRHFRKFLQTTLPDGTIALFRFYDARVFASYMKTATAEELAPWFQGIRQFAIENSSGEGLVRFGMDNGQLTVAVDGVGIPA